MSYVAAKHCPECCAPLEYAPHKDAMLCEPCRIYVPSTAVRRPEMDEDDPAHAEGLRAGIGDMMGISFVTVALLPQLCQDRPCAAQIIPEHAAPFFVAWRGGPVPPERSQSFRDAVDVWRHRLRDAGYIGGDHAD